MPLGPIGRCRLKRGALLALFAGCLGLETASGQPQPPPACFLRGDSRGLPFDVFQIGAPPPFSPILRDYGASSPVYPATDFATTAMQRIKDPSPPSPSGFKFRKYYALWVNRCLQLPGLTQGPDACRNPRAKGNGFFNMPTDATGERIRSAFSSYAKADACTLIQTRRVLGERPLAGLEASAKKAGITLWDGYERPALGRLARTVQGPDGKPSTYLVNICVLEGTPQAADAAGVVLDYEVWDNRTPAQTLSIIRQVTNLVHQHGKSVVLFTDPVPKVPSGLTQENLREVIETVDGFGSAISTGASMGNPTIRYPARARQLAPFPAYLGQLSAITDGGRRPLDARLKKKIIWDVSLYDLSLPEARQLHDEVLRQGYRGVMLARNFLRAGGPCSNPINQTIACVTLGKCDGKFGLDRR